jgi:2',3'-cyclic-nucleotide 2'-phosphodiesterase (5'-nucleotidase family)
MKKLIVLMFSAALFANLYAQDNIKEVQILHWNDFHAHNLPEKRQKKDSTGESVTYYFGGTSDMLGYINKFRNSNTMSAQVIFGAHRFQSY